MEEEQLKNEIFCLNYELKTLSTIITANKLERWLPGFTDPVTDFDHVQRYNWACDFVKDKIVLDIACGSGKGSWILATQGNARQVIGCDIESDAVKYASLKHKSANLTYEVQDATTLKKDMLFDTIISFETVEHIADTDSYLNSINNHLKDDGIFIVSTPIAAQPLDLNPKNPYHVIEWGFKKFQEVVATKLTIEKIYLQLHEARPYGFFERKLNRFFPKKINYKNTRIEEFNKNIAVNKLGRQINGYQILICKKGKN